MITGVVLGVDIWGCASVGVWGGAWGGYRG